MKFHSLGGLSNKNLFSHSSKDWKFKIKVLAGWLSQDSLLGQVATSFSWPLLRACLSLVSNSCFEDTGLFGLRPHHYALINLNCLLKSQFPNTVNSKVPGVRASTYELQGGTIQFITPEFLFICSFTYLLTYWSIIDSKHYVSFSNKM